MMQCPNAKMQQVGKLALAEFKKKAGKKKVPQKTVNRRAYIMRHYMERREGEPRASKDPKGNKASK